MEQFTMDEIFHILSRVIIVFAGVVLLVGVIIRFNQNKPRNQSDEINTTSVKLLPTQGQIKIATKASELNLNGPLVCNFSSPESTLSAYIKDKKIKGEMKVNLITNNFLINGDCVYIWQQGKFTGNKVCGISKYVGLVENFSWLGLPNFKNQSIFPINTSDLNKLIDSCQQKDIKDLSILDIPNNILFKNEELK